MRFIVQGFPSGCGWLEVPGVPRATREVLRYTFFWRKRFLNGGAGFPAHDRRKFRHVSARFFVVYLGGHGIGHPVYCTHSSLFFFIFFYYEFVFFLERF